MHRPFAYCRPGQHVFVEQGAALGHQRNADTARPATAHEILDRAEHALLALLRALRREGVGLVEHELERLAVAVVQPLREVGHEADLLAFAEVGEIEHGCESFVNDQIGDQLAGSDIQRYVAVVAAEDHDRQAGARAIG